jgi:hypothetical protein
LNHSMIKMSAAVLATMSHARPTGALHPLAPLLAFAG